MICKYGCNTEIQWPENYVKGNKPIEPETGMIHTKERCNELKNNFKEQKGFKKIPCKKCGNVVYHNPKHESYDPSEPCTVCNERDGKVAN